MDWRDEPERQPDDTWNYDRMGAAETKPWWAERVMQCVDCGARLKVTTIRARYTRCPACRAEWWKRELEDQRATEATPDEEQPTTVMRLEDVTKPCRNPHCPMRIVKAAAREFCEPCERLLRQMRDLQDRVSTGSLSDWEYGVPHFYGMHRRESIFTWQSGVEDALWLAEHTPAEYYAEHYPVHRARTTGEE